MRKLLVLAFLLISLAAGAIVYVPGSGTTVLPRATTFAYHNGTDDFRFYGSSTWAVRFDFSAVYPSDPNSYFLAQSAVLWLPQIGDSVKVELFSEAAGSPAQRLAQASAQVSQNLMTLPFPQTVQADVLWMLVTYHTNFANRYVSASAGDGTHSYYLNTNAENPYLQSFATAGFDAELLFGISGDFSSSYADIALSSIGFAETLLPRELVHPVFSVYNHSDTSIADASLNLVITSPLPEFSHNITIPIQESIPPRSLYTWGPQSGGYYQHTLTLPDLPLLFKARATIAATSATTDTLANNSLTRYFQAFADSPPLFLVENFARNAGIADLLSQQDYFDAPQLQRLIYFPVLSDTLATAGSMEHFNWYLFNTLPRTVIGGDARISGLTSGYASQYQILAQESLADKTFISSAECRFANQSQDSITAEVSLFNANTHLFTSTAEYNLASNCRWFMGLFRAVPLAGQTRWVLHRWIAHAASVTDNLDAGESSIQSHNISLGGLDLDNQQFRIYYWLQMNGGGKVFYVNWADLNANVAASDASVPALSLDLWPNPLSGSSALKLSFPGQRSYRASNIRIYNMRGQLIYQAPLQHTTMDIPASVFPASGIYILKAESTSRDGHISSRIKRFTVIK